MKRLSSTSSAFFNYINGLRKYFGSEVLSSIAFFVLYLNYDTYNNSIRNAIISMIPDVNEVSTRRRVNERCMQFIVSHREPAASYPKLEYLSKNVVTSEALEDILRQGKNCENLDKFMFNLYFANESSRITVMFKLFLKEVFEVELYMLKDLLISTLANVSSSDESILELDDNMTEYLSVIDGRRENYKLQMRGELRSVIWMVMKKRKRTNVVLAGDMATGKTGLVNNLAYQIAHKECSPEFNDCIVIRVKLLNVFTGGLSPNEIAKKLKEIVQSLISYQEKLGRHIIVFLDDFYCTFAVQENGLRFYYLLMPLLLAENIFSVITCSMSEEEILANDQNIYKNVIGIVVDEPLKKELLDCLKPLTYPLMVYHGISITDDWISKAVLYCKALYHESIILGTLDILDCAMANACNRGRYYLITEDMLDYFINEFKIYDEQSYEIKKLTAFHEAGHFIVSRFCKHYTAVYADLITIIPSDDTGGFNRFEYDESKLKTFGYDFYLESIACCLGGRASEELFLDSISAGAEADLKEATETATSMVSIMALDNFQGQNTVFGNLKQLFIKKHEFAIKGNENLRSEKSINSVSEKVDILMDRAYKIALRQLKRHEDYIKALVKLLLREKIVSRDDIIKLEYKGEDGIIRLKSD